MVYPMVELLTALLTVAVYFAVGFELKLVWACFLLWSGIVVAAIDWRHQIIPDALNICIGIGAFLYLTVQVGLGQGSIVQPLLGGLIGGGFLLFLAYVSSMGGGDIKYMAAAGLFLGPVGTVVALYVAFLAGGLYALTLILMKGRQKGVHLPFGPFLVLGVLVAFAFHERILIFYWNLFA